SLSILFSHVTAPSLMYSLSLHDALPISGVGQELGTVAEEPARGDAVDQPHQPPARIAHLQHLSAPLPQLLDHRPHQGVRDVDGRSEEHTSELQSRENLVCRLLLEKKKTY